MEKSRQNPITCSPSSHFLRIGSVLTVLLFVGCGAGSSPAITSGGNPPTPSIASQPKNQSVPMGLSGSFTVQAIGPNLQYQWSRNGSTIAGATTSTYTTAATAFTDSGEFFTVGVSNPSGSVTSTAALLIVTARAPKAGDLRFRQVDAASTVNGYSIQEARTTSVLCPPPGGGGYSLSFGTATGTGFFLDNNMCGFQFAPFDLPSGVTGLEIAYLAVAMQNYQDALNAPPSYFGFPGPSDSGSVITSIYFAMLGSGVGMGFIHSDTSSGFDRTQSTVPASGLQALATQQGLRGRVLTALSYDGAQATVFSYGWTGDPSAVYEAKVVFATLDTATDQIKGLAAGGYIVTATGCTQADDGSGVILVGTRVQGDTMPRPILVGDVFAGTVDTVFAQGYATVAVVRKYQSPTGWVLINYVGER